MGAADGGWRPGRNGRARRRAGGCVPAGDLDQILVAQFRQFGGRSGSGTVLPAKACGLSPQNSIIPPLMK